MATKYVFIRDFSFAGKVIRKGSILLHDVTVTGKKMVPKETVRVYDNNRDPAKAKGLDMEGGVLSHIMRLDEELFLTAHNSFAYTNWLNEKTGDREDDNETPLYYGVRKCPETMIMFLRDSGLTNPQIMQAMYGKGNKYYEYLAIIKRDNFFAAAALGLPSVSDLQ